MYNNSIQLYETKHLGNDWGFYVDIERPYYTNNKDNLVKKKNCRNYYYNHHNEIDEEIDEEFEYYQYEYNKNMEENSKKIEDFKELDDIDIIKNNSSSLLFHITSITIITAALSYCFLVGL